MRAYVARWRGRIAGGVVIAAIGYAVAVWLDFDPQLVPYVVWAVVLVTLTFLVIDTVEVPAGHWQLGPISTPERPELVTSDLRVLSSHQQADQPSDALALRLVALARARDPDLAAQLQRELADVRRIPPADIDRILTRIESARDRH